MQVPTSSKLQRSSLPAPEAEKAYDVDEVAPDVSVVETSSIPGRVPGMGLVVGTRQVVARLVPAGDVEAREVLDRDGGAASSPEERPVIGHDQRDVPWIAHEVVIGEEVREVGEALRPVVGCAARCLQSAGLCLAGTVRSCRRARYGRSPAGGDGVNVSGGSPIPFG